MWLSFLITSRIGRVKPKEHWTEKKCKKTKSLRIYDTTDKKLIWIGEGFGVVDDFVHLGAVMGKVGVAMQTFWQEQVRYKMCSSVDLRKQS